MTEVAILKILFPPGGSIPPERIEVVQPIRSHIAALMALAEGKPCPSTPGQKHRLQPEQSAALDRRIVELRDELSPQGQRTWAEVAALAGNGMTFNSVRRRYSTYKIREKLADLQREGYAVISGASYTTPREVMQKIESGNHIVELNELVQVSEIAALCRGGKSKEFKTVGAPPALQEATPEQTENPTISDCLIVEDVEEVPTTRLGPKIPHEYNQLIFDLRESGKTFAQIVEALGEKGIVCTIGDASSRYYAMKRKLDAPVAEKQELEPTPKPDPKLDYQEVVDSKIINMKKRGMLNHEIAQVLERNPGGSWTTQKVDARWTQLRREGLA